MSALHISFRLPTKSQVLRASISYVSYKIWQTTLE